MLRCSLRSQQNGEPESQKTSGRPVLCNVAIPQQGISIFGALLAAAAQVS
jgi:hypothetical protein